jgi:hypothetical protein
LSQQLEQVKKQITFEELCPKWSEAIRNRRIAVGAGISTGYKCCIVGEAHGFDYGYSQLQGGQVRGCDTCQILAVRLVPGSIIHFRDGSLHIDNKNFERHKEEFMKHWNEKHC